MAYVILLKNVFKATFIFTFMAVEANMQVKVSQGILQGESKTSKSGFSYNAFLSIPYAKPPTGPLRFKDPEPSEEWEGIRDATKIANICPQSGFPMFNMYLGDEDCLYLNIYTPGETIDSSSRLPVMFWIHGGGFALGDGNADKLYGPDYLIEHNVIFVSINYRLGALGFMCLDLPEVPGNAGLKDQVMALKWVSEHIHNFGGDSKQITIFGESAGGASTSLLMLSPLAQGLFDKVISQSGTALNEWVINDNPSDLAVNFAKALGFETENKSEIFNYLQNASAEKLVMISRTLEMKTDNFLLFVPVIEKKYSNIKSFINKSPREMIKNGDFTKVPYLSGFLSHEGILKMLKNPEITYENVTLHNVIQDFEIFIPKYLKNSLSHDEKTATANQMKDFYFDTEDNLRGKFINFFTDFLFIKDIYFTAKEMARHGVPSYFYKFSYHGALNVMRYLIKYKADEACHGDDLGYIFKVNLLSLIPHAKPSDRDILLRKQMTKLWTNFAKTGNPTPEISETIPFVWKPATPDEINCLLISDDLAMVSNPLKERMQFWDKLEESVRKSN